MNTRLAEHQAGCQDPKVGAIVPVYHEEEAICRVLERLRLAPVSTICVVIDAPLKEAMTKVRESAARSGKTVHIIKNKDRTGIGSALRQGFKYLSETGHDIAVVMAGNGKDDPAEVHRLIGPIAQSDFDYVQGSRYLPGGKTSRMPPGRFIFNRLYPYYWSLLTGKRCTDVTNGFRCFRLAILRDHRINLEQDWLDGYSLEYYLLFKLLTLGYRVREVPVSKIYPFGHKGGYSKIQPLKDWWPILSPLLLLFFGVRK